MSVHLQKRIKYNRWINGWKSIRWYYLSISVCVRARVFIEIVLQMTEHNMQLLLLLLLLLLCVRVCACGFWIVITIHQINPQWIFIIHIITAHWWNFILSHMWENSQFTQQLHHFMKFVFFCSFATKSQMSFYFTSRHTTNYIFVLVNIEKRPWQFELYTKAIHTHIYIPNAYNNKIYIIKCVHVIWCVIYFVTDGW